jgi:hypothetical protein
MQKIDGLNTTAKINTQNKLKKKDLLSNDFTKYLAKNDKTSQANNILATTSITDIIFKENIDESDLLKHERKRAKKIIEKLEELRDQMLEGDIDSSLLVELQDISSSLDLQYLTNDKLKSLINDIELRAAVEVAKLEK